MSVRPAVLEITAETIRAVGGTGRCPPPALVRAALEWIDDPIGLYDERPTAVADMWRSVVVTLVGPRCAAVLVVHPGDWPAWRVDRVVAAVNTVTDHIEVVSRDQWSGRVPEATPAELSGKCTTARRGLATIGRSRGAALAAAAALLAAGWVGLWLVGPGRVGPDESGRTVVEGRMAVRIPPQWDIQRVTGGPGSRRLQVTAPDDPTIAVHLTSSYAPEATLPEAAEVIGRAIAGEPPGVFGDLQPAASVGGRPAVTYLENRPGRVIRWTVVLTGSLRIGVGCQSPPGREAEVRSACEEAVRSARESSAPEN